jgi:hypothetical protein
LGLIIEEYKGNHFELEDEKHLVEGDSQQVQEEGGEN